MTNLACYKNLGAAIVLQAYKDYRTLARKCKSNPHNKAIYIAKMKDIVSFAKSEWYTQLCRIPQRAFLDKLKEVMDIDET